jgi:alkylated DNA nucleotide flippase Atl1
MASKIDREAIRKLVDDELPFGRWISYGDVAEAVGHPRAIQAVARIVATYPPLRMGHRVLRDDGTISPGWKTAWGGGGGPEVARRRLEDEGVMFDGDRADRRARWRPARS